MTETNALSADTATTVQRAMALARQGDIAGACRTGEQGLAEGGDAATLNAMLGMLHCRAGALDKGVAHLQSAHVAHPNDFTVANNLVAALIELGRTDEALRYATRDLAIADPTLQLARFRGYLAQLGEDFPVAVDAYEHVVAREPNDWESWNNLGNARGGTSDFLGGAEALKRAVALNPLSPPILFNLGKMLGDAGLWDEAEATFRKGVEEFTDDAKFPTTLYAIFRRQGRDDEAIGMLERAIEIEPTNADNHVLLGIEYSKANRVGDSEHSILKAIELVSDHAEAHTALADLFERMNRDGEFAELIEKAVKRGVDESAVDFIRMLEHRRAKRFAEALAALDNVPSFIDPVRRAHLAGQFHDGLGQADQAFAAFSEMNRCFTEDLSDPSARASEFRKSLRDERRILTPDWLASWSKLDTHDERRSPVFLVGFPRSGTTLLDTILMGHPGVHVLEERPMLNQVRQSIGDHENLATLDADGLRQARDLYFEKAAEWVDLDPGKMLIDKHPLHLNKVPLIHRLFPDARFILALRHPCDALFSCFSTNFRLNHGMANFLDLETGAEFYDLTFGYWEQARALLPLNVHTIVYERMVEDAEREVRPLVEWLGLDWREELLDHRRTAATRGLIPTASYSQVTEAIYKRSTGRWTRYRDHLAPILPTLAPWVEKFGYSLDDGTIPPWPET